MAAPKALFDLQYYVCRSAGQVAAGESLVQPAIFTQALEGLAGQSLQLRHIMATKVLTSPMRGRLTAIEQDALLENLVPEARGRPEAFKQLTWGGALQGKARPLRSYYRLGGPSFDQPTEWDRWDLHSEVRSHLDCTTAQTWFHTSAPLAEIAPRLDPQLWDARPEFIDEAFGIDSYSDCNVQHDKATNEIDLGRSGYRNKRLHEKVSGSFGELSAGLSCDLTVSFEKAFGATVPNHALYELHCNHERLIKRNEGQSYVKDEGKLGRLVYASKHLCFTDDAPEFLRAIAPVLLPIWLTAIVVGTLSSAPVGPPTTSSP
jgi:hypothetical protein